jgi:hypothetical protein
MYPLKNKIIIQKRKYQVLFTENMQKSSHFKKPEAKNMCYATHLVSICTMVAFCYPGMQYSTADTCWNAARLFHEKTATLKASAVSAQEMLAVRTLVGHLGEITKLLSSAQLKTKPTPHQV